LTHFITLNFNFFKIHQIKRNDLLIAISTGQTENRIGLEIIMFPNIIVDEENIDPEKNHNLNFATVHRKLRNAPRVQTSQNAATSQHAAQKKMKNVKDIHREQTPSKSTYKPNLEKQNPERKNERDLYQAGEGEEELRFLT